MLFKSIALFALASTSLAQPNDAAGEYPNENSYQIREVSVRDATQIDRNVINIKRTDLTRIREVKTREERVKTERVTTKLREADISKTRVKEISRTEFDTCGGPCFGEFAEVNAVVPDDMTSYSTRRVYGPCSCPGWTCLQTPFGDDLLLEGARNAPGVCIYTPGLEGIDAITVNALDVASVVGDLADTEANASSFETQGATTDEASSGSSVNAATIGAFAAGGVLSAALFGAFACSRRKRKTDTPADADTARAERTNARKRAHDEAAAVAMREIEMKA